MRTVRGAGVSVQRVLHHVRHARARREDCAYVALGLVAGNDAGGSHGGPLLSLDDGFMDMTFVTTLTLSSGDRHLLDDVVDDIKQRAGRKGVEFKGPHPKPPDEYRVPMQKHLDGGGGDRFDPWRYTVYTRTLRIVGHDGFARQIAGQAYPDAVHVEAEVEQVTGAGRT